MEKGPQILKKYREHLEKQQYRVVGTHSAVKTCHWTKEVIRGGKGCYKLKFYGILSNQCMQMTTSLSCANRCRFCWRDYKAPVAKEWKWDIDRPEKIIEESLYSHHKLLIGFKGNKNSSKGAYSKSREVKHVALSLTGEPITYPELNSLLQYFNAKKISTFLVTNAQYPDKIRDLEPVTQLYISLDAPTKELLKGIDVPLFHDYWERLNQSLKYMAEKKQRTCIRLTLIKGMNMEAFEEYAKMIKKGDPDFIEIKAYMYVGASIYRLIKGNMPYQKEVIAFAKVLSKHLEEYEIVSEHAPSRVVMLAKKKFKRDGEWHTWIDFDAYHDLVMSEKEFCSEDYLQRTPITGLENT